MGFLYKWSTWPRPRENKCHTRDSYQWFRWHDDQITFSQSWSFSRYKLIWRSIYLGCCQKWSSSWRVWRSVSKQPQTSHNFCYFRPPICVWWHWPRPYGICYFRWKTPDNGQWWLRQTRHRWIGCKLKQQRRRPGLRWLALFKARKQTQNPERIDKKSIWHSWPWR